MAGESLGTAVLELTTDSRGIDRGLAEGERKASGWTQRVGGVLGGAMSFVTGGIILKGLNALGDGLKSLAGGMIDGNAQFEQYNTQFQVMLGSAEAAQTRMAELAKFGASTPFDLPQVVEADRIIQGFGLHAEEAAKRFGYSGQEIRTIAGDVASGTGSSFSEMALLIGKFSSGATGEAISRMQELGITNRDELRKMGLEFSKSGELLSPLPKAMNVVLGLMKKKYGGLMEAQSRTFGGMMSNLRDWIGNTMRMVGRPIFDALKNQLGNLLNFLGSAGVQAALQRFASGIGAAISTAVSWITGTLVPAVSGVVNWVTTFVANHGAEIQAFLAGAWQRIGGIVQTALSIIQATVVPALTAIAGFISSHGAEIQRLLGNAWTFIRTAIDTALTLIQGILSLALALIQGDWSTAWEIVKATVDRVWQNIQTLLGAALDNILMLLGTDLEEAKAVISEKFTAAYNFVSNIFGRIRSTIENAMNGIASFLGSIQLPNPFAALGAAVDWVRGKIEGLLNWLRNLNIPNPFANFGFGGGGGGGFAGGTSFAPGGMALVGERGPELVNLPRGSQVLDAGATSRLLRGLSGPQLAPAMAGITIQSMTINAQGGPAEVERAVRNGLLSAARQRGLR